MKISNLRKIYRTVCPKSIRNVIWQIVFFIPNTKKKIEDRKYEKIRKDVIAFLEKEGTHNDILSYVKANKDIVFPYDFTKKYNVDNIEVFRENGFPYVLHNGKKLFGKKSMSNDDFKGTYRQLLMEQDLESPHRYLFENRFPKDNCVIADVGAAEGIFALNVIDTAKKVYLFECQQEWIEALKLTFAPYSEKIEVVNKFVAEKDDSQKNMITMDSFFADKQIDYVKADIEGAEESMLLGGKNVFTKKVKQVLLCCYHRNEAESFFRKNLSEMGFAHIDVNSGYMIWVDEQSVTGTPISAPYLRHGVLYASKQCV